MKDENYLCTRSVRRMRSGCDNSEDQVVSVKTPDVFFH